MVKEGDERERRGEGSMVKEKKGEGSMMKEKGRRKGVW